MFGESKKKAKKEIIEDLVEDPQAQKQEDEDHRDQEGQEELEFHRQSTIHSQITKGGGYDDWHCCCQCGFGGIFYG